jgi:hypothetical protein
MVCVDPTFSGAIDGTYEQPWGNFNDGLLNTPTAGTLGLRAAGCGLRCMMWGALYCTTP